MAHDFAALHDLGLRPSMTALRAIEGEAEVMAAQAPSSLHALRWPRGATGR